MKTYSLLILLTVTSFACASTRHSASRDDGMRELNIDKDRSNGVATRMGLFQLPRLSVFTFRKAVGEGANLRVGRQIARLATKTVLRHMGYFGLSEIIYHNTGNATHHRNWLDSLFVRRTKKREFGREVWHVDTRFPLLYCRSFLNYQPEPLALESAAEFRTRLTRLYHRHLSAMPEVIALLNGLSFEDHIFMHSVYLPESDEALMYAVSQDAASAPPHDHLFKMGKKYLAQQAGQAAAEATFKKGPTRRAILKRAASAESIDLKQDGIVVPAAALNRLLK